MAKSKKTEAKAAAGKEKSTDKKGAQKFNFMKMIAAKKKKK